MSWTDERIELLRKRWSEGHSASQIATELGGVTRNAVIGKVHRLKLESRIKAAPTAAEAKVETPPAAPRTLEAVPQVAAAPVVETVRVQAESAPRLVIASQTHIARQPSVRAVGATALKMDEEIEAVATHVEDEDRQSAEIVPISRNLTLIQLSERTCKWPLGDPLSPDFRFCGNHSGEASPYCKYHARLAFQPVSERRRVR